MAVLNTFTTRAKHVLAYAQAEATHFNHPYVGSEHLLLGLTRNHQSVAGRVLDDLGVQHAQVRSAVWYIVGHGHATSTSDDLELAASAKTVLAYALEAGRTLKHPYVGTAHLLLGLVRTDQGAAAGVLDIMGINREQVRTTVLRALHVSPSPETPYSALPRPRRTARRQHGVSAAGHHDPPERTEVLQVSIRSQPSAVAEAIAGVVRAHGSVAVEAIGTGAANQGIKAVAIARADLAEDGIDIACVPSFIELDIDDEDRTAIRLVIQRRDGPASGAVGQDVAPPMPG